MSGVRVLLNEAEALQASLDDAAEIIGRQRLEISELREALKPFASIAIQAEQAWTSGQYYAPEEYVRPAIRLKHFIAARAALAKSGASQ